MALNQVEMRELLSAVGRTSDPGDRARLMAKLLPELEPFLAKLPMPKAEAPEAPAKKAPAQKKAPAKKEETEE